MTITVFIEEQHREEFEVEAETIEEAMKIAQSQYYNGEIQLDPFAVPSHVEFTVVHNNVSCTESYY